MDLLKITRIGLFLCFCLNLQAQTENKSSDTDQIRETLMNYIDGTANGQIEKLEKAFHPDFNLYSVTKDDSLRIWKGKDYINNFKEGKKSNRIGKIISIDFENDAAIAKAEIEIPNWRIFTDYFLLLKYEGSWKIVHKSYTWKSATPSHSAQFLEEKLKNTNINGFNEWLVENRKSTDFILNESTLNAFGYGLLYDQNRPGDAVKVFDLIVDLYPTSSNAYDSAGEGHLSIGNYEKSVGYYQKAIDLNAGVQFHQLGYLPSAKYQPTVIPNDTTHLFQIRGNMENEVAFVYVQGGPDLQLNIGPRDGLHLMPNHNDLLKIYPYQGQMLNPNILASDPILTESQSAFENDQSVEILERVIKYLVNRNKRVFLIGHSYGASISMEYVSSRDNIAEKVVLMGLDLDEDISSWDSLKSGEYIRWENGEKPFSRVVFQEIPIDHPSKSSFDRVADNLAVIVGTNMKKKYTSLFTDEDFKNIISVHANRDVSNGKKSAEELEILTKKGSTIIEIDGGHHAMLTTQFMTDLYEHLIHSKSIKSNY